MYTSRFAKDLNFETWEATNDFYTDFACGMVSCPSASLVKVLIALIALHGRSFDPFADAV